MKAARIEETGAPEVISYRDYPMPDLGPGDILVKVLATSVSGWDLKYRSGKLAKSAVGKGLPGRSMFPMPQQLGREASGVVVAVGDNSTRFKEGERVLGLVHPENPDCDMAIRGRGNLSTGVNYPGHSGLGGNAQFVSRPENYWVPLPDNVGFEAAAAGSWSFPTSRRIIVDRCNVQTGDVVMITGTSGGMGNASLQWAKLAGARVIAATRSEAKVPILEAMGADLVVISDELEFSIDRIMTFTQGKGVNHYIEYTGAPELTALPKKILALGGTVCLAAGDVIDERIPFCVMDFTRLEMQLVGIRGSRLRDQVAYLEQLALGSITVPIAREMPLSEISEAHRLMESGALVGKIVLLPWDAKG